MQVGKRVYEWESKGKDGTEKQIKSDLINIVIEMSPDYHYTKDYVKCGFGNAFQNMKYIPIRFQKSLPKNILISKTARRSLSNVIQLVTELHRL